MTHDIHLKKGTKEHLLKWRRRGHDGQRGSSSACEYGQLGTVWERRMRETKEAYD